MSSIGSSPTLTRTRDFIQTVLFITYVLYAKDQVPALIVCFCFSLYSEAQVESNLAQT